MGTIALAASRGFCEQPVLTITCERGHRTHYSEGASLITTSTVVTVTLLPRGAPSSPEQGGMGSIHNRGKTSEPHRTSLLEWFYWKLERSLLFWLCPQTPEEDSSEHCQGENESGSLNKRYPDLCRIVMRPIFLQRRPQGIYYSAIIINRSLWNPGTQVSWREGGKCWEKSCERQRSSQTRAINHRPPLFPEDSFIVP